MVESEDLLKLVCKKMMDSGDLLDVMATHMEPDEQSSMVMKGAVEEGVGSIKEDTHTWIPNRRKQKIAKWRKEEETVEMKWRLYSFHEIHPRWKKGKVDKKEDTEEMIEVLMVSSPKRDDLVFPKGGWEDDETVTEAACREALEEAGVKGIIIHLLLSLPLPPFLSLHLHAHSFSPSFFHSSIYCRITKLFSKIARKELILRNEGLMELVDAEELEDIEVHGLMRAIFEKSFVIRRRMEEWKKEGEKTWRKREGEIDSEKENDVAHHR
ncbi:hypothetical protein LR48_Vigan07g246500 [Vigna angularis]|uniref:Nudix hydrolase domain-containing protein n=1 Tax=Phaseolus angularis TaxID=3914 RepID=A0A0L9V1D1_PHAAN|nr:hypothetical protein LR48_Vigan07g246500 [Vigna angularis]